MSTVVICPYSAEWPEVFHAVRAELLSIFSMGGVSIEHIGSTSVPGLSAKPVIDVLLAMPSLAQIEMEIPALAGLGYEYRPSYELDIPERRYFVKSWVPCLRVHLHAVEGESRIRRMHLSFRNALRGDRILALKYQVFKERLALEHANDKAKYSAAKAPFIERVLSEYCGDVR